MLERNPHLGAAVVAFMYSQTRTVVKLRVTFISFHLLLFAFMWEGARVLNVGRRVLAEHTCRNSHCSPAVGKRSSSGSGAVSATMYVCTEHRFLLCPHH